ncbi:MAG: hypothetical protein HY077_14320 [Elusimicrobia bacterium]|nr:hypothetical protein [Elusimicrobiota bacterium]
MRSSHRRLCGFLVLLVPQLAFAAAIDELHGLDAEAAAGAPPPAAKAAPSFQAVWKTLVDESLTKDAAVVVWGMDRYETRHNFTFIAVKKEGKVYLVDDENTERDITHTVFVTDLRGDAFFSCLSYSKPYGDSSPTRKSDLAGRRSVYHEYKSLMLGLAAGRGFTARPAKRGDCSGKGPSAEAVTLDLRGGYSSRPLITVRFEYDSCAQFWAPREMTHPSPMVNFNGWRYKSKEGYVLYLENEAGDEGQDYQASVMLARDDGKTGAATELGAIGDAELALGRRIAIDGPVSLDDRFDPAKRLTGKAALTGR